MVQSLNAKPEVMTKGNSFHAGLNANFGMMMTGDKAFEFYNEKNQLDYIQIPYEEIDYVLIQVFNRGKFIRTFIIQTKNNGKFKFNSKEAGKLLKSMQSHLKPEQMQKARGFIRRTQVLIENLKNKKASKENE